MIWVNVVGASIFVPENTILYDAARDFGLGLSSVDLVYDEDDDDSMGMYPPFICL